MTGDVRHGGILSSRASRRNPLREASQTVCKNSAMCKSRTYYFMHGCPSPRDGASALSPGRRDHLAE
jgi:hypothetical protein